jgi:hypothetical protein
MIEVVKVFGQAPSLPLITLFGANRAAKMTVPAMRVKSLSLRAFGPRKTMKIAIFCRAGW